MKFCIKIGGVTVGVTHRYPYIKLLCQDYMSDASPLVSVSVTDAQIDDEMTLTENRFPREVCEATCLHREVVKALVPHGMMLIHSAVIAVDGEAYVFLAKSGVGKSTHVRLWRDMFGDRATVVNGDKPMFSFCADTLYAHGTPWRGKEGWGENISLPVRAFCFLERGEVNEITPAGSGDIISKIFHQVLLPTDAPNMKLFMNMIDRIMRDVPFYKLRCNMEQEAARVAYAGMRGERT